MMPPSASINFQVGGRTPDAGGDLRHLRVGCVQLVAAVDGGFKPVGSVVSIPFLPSIPFVDDLPALGSLAQAARRRAVWSMALDAGAQHGARPADSRRTAARSESAGRGAGPFELEAEFS